MPTPDRLAPLQPGQRIVLPEPSWERVAIGSLPVWIAKRRVFLSNVGKNTEKTRRCGKNETRGAAIHQSASSCISENHRLLSDTSQEGRPDTCPVSCCFTNSLATSAPQR